MANSEKAGSFDDRLAKLKIELPRVPAPIGNFVPFRRHGKLVLLAGQICEWNGEVVFRGKIGRDLDLATGQDAARICGLNLIAALRAACGGTLDPVEACLRLGGFVNCDPEYTEVPKVINGASDLMHELFGEAGAHARTAVSVATLPQGAAVEVDAIFAVR
jgi:enamine deaminase RidA (YjgF/YER057c/UK114 family)